MDNKDVIAFNCSKCHELRETKELKKVLREEEIY